MERSKHAFVTNFGLSKSAIMHCCVAVCIFHVDGKVLLFVICNQDSCHKSFCYTVIWGSKVDIRSNQNTLHGYENKLLHVTFYILSRKCTTERAISTITLKAVITSR